MKTPELTLYQLLVRCDPEQHDHVMALWERSGVHYIVLYEDPQGHRRSLALAGPGQQFAALEDAEQTVCEDLRAVAHVRGRHAPGKVKGKTQLLQYLKLARKVPTAIDDASPEVSHAHPSDQPTALAAGREGGSIGGEQVAPDFSPTAPSGRPATDGGEAGSGPAGGDPAAVEAVMEPATEAADGREVTPLVEAGQEPLLSTVQPSLSPARPSPPVSRGPDPGRHHDRTRAVQAVQKELDESLRLVREKEEELRQREIHLTEREQFVTSSENQLSQMAQDLLEREMLLAQREEALTLKESEWAKKERAAH